MKNPPVDCPVCSKPVKNLAAHFRRSHPDLNLQEYTTPPGAVNPPPPPDPVPAAAAAPNPDAEAAVNALLAIVREQQQAMQQMQQQIAAQQKQFVDFQQSVIDGLNGMPQLVDHSVTSRLDQMAAEIQAQTQPAASEAKAMTAAAQDPKMAMFSSLAPLIAQILAGGQQQQGGMGQIVEQITGLGNLMNTIAGMQRAPWMEGAKFVTDVFATGARIGLTPEQTALSMGKTLKDMGGNPAT